MIKKILKKAFSPLYLLGKKIVKADERILDNMDDLPKKWLISFRSYLEMFFR